MKETYARLDTMTQTELAELAALCLERLEPGRQPLPLFKQLARHVVTSTVEMVPLRLRGDKLEVLMVQRPDDDPWWPGQWHLPGTVLLPTDKASDVHDYDTPVERLLNDEFSHSVLKSSNVNIFDAQRRLIPRGSEQTVFGWSLVELAEGIDEAKGGTFFQADVIAQQLDGEHVVAGHLDTVATAIADYRNQSD